MSIFEIDSLCAFVKSRRIIISAYFLSILIFGVLFSLYGYEKTWRLWNIPTMSPHFADLRCITAGAESRAQGFDPMVHNPADPWQRRINYPRVWQSLYLIGVDQTHTTYIGIAFIILFLAGVCLILPRASLTMVALVMAALLSPAVLLGVERANIDLFIFFLVSISVVAVSRWPIMSSLVVLIGFILKIFPVFGFAVLLKVSRSVFFRYILFIFAFATLYSILIYSDLLLIRETTPQSMFLTYGLNVFWMGARYFDAMIGDYARILSYLAVLLLSLYAFSALFRNDFRPEKMESQTLYLDAFRAGAAIYLGTFLLNNNWDHRLMFLIFTIPQLVLWGEHTVPYIANSSLVVLSSIILSMWYLIIAKIARHLIYGGYISYTLDKLFHWIVFAGLLYLFFWSMPDWVKADTRKAYSLIRRNREYAR